MRRAGFGQIAVFVAKDLFVLQRFHERLAGRVVPRIAFARHADVDAVGLRADPCSRRWRTANRGRNDAPGRAATARRESAIRNAASVSRIFHGSIQRPTDHAARVGVQDHRQEHELVAQPDVGDIGHPQLIDAGQHHFARQVRIDLARVVGIGGDDELPLPHAQQVVFAHDPVNR